MPLHGYGTTAIMCVRTVTTTGPVDIVAMNPEGEITLIDVKSYKDGRLSAKTPLQKNLVYNICTTTQRHGSVDS